MITYCIVYRTGGPENFKWYRTHPMTYHDAKRKCDSVLRQSYLAHVEEYEESMSAGLPETYEYVEPFA